jgi:hypothetical protein
MKLSAPIYVLKSQAKDLEKHQGIALSKALDEVATREGYATWSQQDLGVVNRHSLQV